MSTNTLTTKQKKELRRILIAGILFAVLMIVEHTAGIGHTAEGDSAAAGIGRWGMFGLFLIPYLIVGLSVLRAAVLGIGHGQIFDESFLMSVATIGAFAVGENAEAVAVMLFYQIGEFFQSYAVGKSRRSISALMELAPEYANIEDADGNLEQVDPDDVEEGTLLVILPGEKIPIDGIVEEGESLVSTAAMTGEPVPRGVHPGSEVISGCVNGEGTLRVRTTKLYEDSTVAKVLDLVENAAAKKSRTENFITRFAKYYTPVVVIGALALALIPPLFMGNWGDWILRACTFLVISCPCALVISVPLSFFGGIGAASKQGILVKGSNYLELLTETGTVVTDKTGTLTRGVFAVQKLVPACDAAAVPEKTAQTGETGMETAEQKEQTGGAGMASAEQKEQNGGSGMDPVEYGLLRAAAAAEQLSTHPIALSIKEAYEKQVPDTELPKLTTAKNHSGQGIEACTEEGICILAGNAGLMRAFGVTFEEADDPAATVVYVAAKEAEEVPVQLSAGCPPLLARRVLSGGEQAYVSSGLQSPAESVASGGSQTRTAEGAYAPCASRQERRGVLEKNNAAEGQQADEAVQKQSADATGMLAEPGHKTGTFRYIGALLIADEIKPEAGEAVGEMRRSGIDVVMLTGDRKEAAESVAEKLGINRVKAGLLPADKVDAVEELLSGKTAAENGGKSGSDRKVAFVGDGINDAPVLARADVGIAMGSLGSDAAIEAADIVIMDDDLRKIPLAVRIAQKTMRIARQNIVFALGVKILILVLGALGLANMWAAVFADVGVAVIAILNAMRTMR